MKNSLFRVSVTCMLLTTLCIFFSSSVIATPDASSRLFADNWDGTLHISHARQALQHAVGKINLPSDDVLRLDQDGDGALSIADARILLQKVVGKWTPTPFTEKVNNLPDGERVDFRALGQTKIASAPNTETNGLYLAKSYTDLKAILSQLYADAGVSAPDVDEAYTGIDFANHAVLVLHCVDGAGNTTQRVDNLLRVDGQLILCSTAVQEAQPTPDMGNRFLLVEIDIQVLAGIQTLVYYNEQEFFD